MRQSRDLKPADNLLSEYGVIPIKLKLRNFMAYRESSLDFQGIHLAVLTGENGAGKSTLLDAITWALWGRARAKRDDELIHLGQSEMEAEYTFDLGGSIYRIIRKRDASKRGRSDLSFHIEDAGGWRTLTDTSLRLTQQKINEVMRLDYDTFINSAFLLQGRADEFTTKAPGKRKEILSDILGLGQYDIYGERARQKAVEKEREADGLSAKIEQIEQEIAKENHYRAELAQAEQSRAQVNRELQLADQAFMLLQEKHRSINEKQRQLDDLQLRLRQAETDIKESGESISESEATLARYQAILQRREEIEAGLATLQQARQRVQDWEQRLQASVKLSSRQHELDRAFAAARAEIEAELRGVQAKINLLRPKVALIEPQRAQLAEAEDNLARLEALAQQREADKSASTTLKQEAARLQEQNKQLKIEMDEIKANLVQLEEAGSTCPICRRPLEAEHQAEVLQQFQNEGRAKGDLYRTNQSRLKSIAAEEERLQQQISQAERSLPQLAAGQGEVARLKQSLQEAEVAAGQLDQAGQVEAELQQQLATQSFALDVITELNEVKAELATLGYDEAAHQQARRAVEQLTPFETEGRALDEAEKRISQAQQQLAKAQARHERLLAQTTADRARVSELTAETGGLAELSRQLNQASSEVDRLQREERLAREQVIRIEQQLSHLAYLAKQRGEHEINLQKVREGQSIYRELQTAFGKKGIQALLIESAIPEIEDEANHLLGRMTDGRMHLRFETQREAKSSDQTIETLDILIADELGSRDYEMYSGGEAFRVNFAIRVAMSKVLARRAGARLQTLIIDEGFGTQDGPGRERLVEAINTIQADFAKIIVITHIDELKEAFPVRIEVWKNSEGSHVTIC
jgi:exonuclease SbcC